jgi:hypothetical protein
MNATRRKSPQGRRPPIASSRPFVPIGWRAVRALAIVLVAAVLVLPAAALAQEPALVVAVGEQVPGSVSTVTQDIRVDGVVGGDVTSWSGSITIAGTVGGDVVSYGGAVTILASGRVGGHVLASGGALRLEPGATVAGQKISDEGSRALASVLDLFIPSGAATDLGPVGRALFAAVLGVLLLAFCMLYVAFWPGRVAITGTTLRRLPGRGIALGLLTTLALALALVPLAGLLVASVVGLPLLLVLLVLAVAPYVYGLAVLARTAGARLARQPGRAASLGGATFASARALVLPIAVVAAAAPAWGLALFYLLASPGLGAAILSRGGMLLPLAAR